MRAKGQQGKREAYGSAVLEMMSIGVSRVEFHLHIVSVSSSSHALSSWRQRQLTVP